MQVIEGSTLRAISNELWQFVFAPLPLFIKQYKLVLTVRLGNKANVFHDYMTDFVSEIYKLSWHQAEGLVGVQCPRQH